MPTYATPAPAPSPSPAHPLHGILAAYPLAFFSGALFTDIVYANSADMMWANFSAWLITGGLFMGVLAAVAGIVDAVLTRRRQRRESWVHSATTVLMMVLAVVNIFVHSRDAWTSVVPTGLVLSGIVTVLALVSSWFGYSLQSRQEAR